MLTSQAHTGQFLAPNATITLSGQGEVTLIATAASKDASPSIIARRMTITGPQAPFPLLTLAHHQTRQKPQPQAEPTQQTKLPQAHQHREGHSDPQSQGRRACKRRKAVEQLRQWRVWL